MSLHGIEAQSRGSQAVAGRTGSAVLLVGGLCERECTAVLVLAVEAQKAVEAQNLPSSGGSGAEPPI
eukprot:4484703-Prorocentrum_lima.AAC.1